MEDLFQRGLLDNTMVACLAEFGRTPKVNPAGGRDHWPNCWTVNFAGGGVKGGRVVGKSDDIGAYPVERPVKPAEVVATIYQSSGSTWKPNCPARNRARFRWSITARSRSRSCSSVQPRHDQIASGRNRGDFVAPIRCPRTADDGRRLANHPGKFTLHGRASRQQVLVELFATALFTGKSPMASLGIERPENSETRRRRGIAGGQRNGANRGPTAARKPLSADVTVEAMEQAVRLEFSQPRPAGAGQGRMQRRRLPRRGGGPERFQAFLARLRQPGRFPRADPPGLRPPRRSRATPAAA